MDSDRTSESENLNGDYKSSPSPAEPDQSAETADPSSEDHSGATLNGYKLVRKLAEGGMGVVYEGQQLNLSRNVAIKILNEQLASRKEFVERFHREARAAAALNHPNMVQVHDFGESNGLCYLVMEFVEGKDLSDYIDFHGKMPITQALGVIEQAAHALKFAYEHSIVHRDIKPSNLMLTLDGRVKISDLGLSKNMTEVSDLTLSGIGMGSPYFMAPEQASDAKGVDHRADIYALGLTLLYLLTAKRPFEGNTPYSIILSHANKPLPQGKELGTDLPAEVEYVIQRMAAKDPENRYVDYDSLIEDLQRVKEGYAPTLKPIRLTTFQRGAAIGTAIFVLIFIAFTLYWRNPQIRSFKIERAQAKAAQNPSPVAASQPAEPQRIESDRRRTFAPEHDGPPRQDRLDREEEGLPGPEGRDDPHLQRNSGGMALPLSPLPHPNQHPLQDGAIDTMLAEARKYATENPQNYRDQIDSYRQVLAKVRGTPQQKAVDEEMDGIRRKHQQAIHNAMETYQQKSREALRTGTPAQAYAVWRDFPNFLRTRESDSEIQGFLTRLLPPDFTPP